MERFEQAGASRPVQIDWTSIERLGCDRLANTVNYVPFGYEPEKDAAKGTILYFGVFDDADEAFVDGLIQLVKERDFKLAVLYPQHEETLRRMKFKAEQPYYARVKNLQSLLGDHHGAERLLSIDQWEGKRKKYTPLDTSLAFLTEHYPPPFFVAMSGEYANAFASYPVFKEWIRKVRLLVVADSSFQPHPALMSHESRWEYI